MCASTYVRMYGLQRGHGIDCSLYMEPLVLVRDEPFTAPPTARGTCLAAQVFICGADSLALLTVTSRTCRPTDSGVLNQLL